MDNIITPEWIEKTKTTEYETELARALVIAFGEKVLSRWNEVQGKPLVKSLLPEEKSLRLIKGGKK